MSTLDEIGRHCLRAFNASVATSVAVFYRIDDNLEARDFQLHGMPIPMHRAYLSHYRAFDPLRPRHCLDTGREVVPLRLGQTRQSDASNRSYQGFLQRHEIVDVAEILARVDGRPVAAVSLLRRASLGAFNPRELAVLNALQGLMQIAVRDLPRPRGAPPPHPELTAREQQIAARLRDGVSNKQLARELGIGLPTVKTHLINLYRKLGVDNRTRLVAKLYLDNLDSADAL